MSRHEWPEIEQVPKHVFFHGGSQKALERLGKICASSFLEDYDADRNFPAKDRTSLLSPYLKFGCVSIREVYWAIVNTYSKDHAIINEFYWRAFYDQMVYWWPHTLQGKPWNIEQKVSWASPAETKRIFKRITQAKTGIPIVDASVRCLVNTGFLHNRLRMILCMLAVRICHIDWKIMEKWYAQHAIDYHPSSNRGGWEWALLYRYILNPWVQTHNFDYDCEFIKKWMPELQDVPSVIICEWYDGNKRKEIKSVNYARLVPLLDRKCQVSA